MHTITMPVEHLDRASAERLEALALSLPGVRGVETWRDRAELSLDDPAHADRVIAALHSAGFNGPAASAETCVVAIRGMTCRACELTIEKSVRNIDGVTEVSVDAARGTATITAASGKSVPLTAVRRALANEKYVVESMTMKPAPERKGGKLRAAGLLTAVAVAGLILDRLGAFDRTAALGGSVSFASALVLGLVAGSSSCIAVAGGLLLSSAGIYRERFGDRSFAHRLAPVAMFTGGRIVSYTVFGGLIGILGQSFALPPFANGMLTVAAAAVMLVMGLDMLGLAPSWFKRLIPSMPKTVGRKVVGAEKMRGGFAPALLGAATFFLPCGFTQSLQLYALASKNATTGAMVLGAFAIGTAPALLGVGWASSSLKGKVGMAFFRFAGAVAVILGVMNVRNGLAAAGLPSLDFGASQTATAVVPVDQNVSFDGQTQVIRMSVTGSAPFYSPSDRYTVRAGTPVRMEIGGEGAGCRSIFQIAQLGVSTELDKPVNILEFTPKQAGRLTFSCSMGMYRGTINVLPSSS